MRVLVCFSMSEDEAATLAREGPRRDIELVAEKLGATLLFRGGQRRRGPRWLNRLVGPHLRHAWTASEQARAYDVVFADGEHVGVPLLFFLRLRGRHTRVVILCHLIDRPWKRALLWVGTRLQQPGQLLVHSSVQGRIAKASVGGKWAVELLPYQVDSEFWTARVPSQHEGTTVAAVGSEHRDYETLAAAVAGMDVSVRIAAGSHWARATATAEQPPPNVQLERRTLPFTELRRMYEEADIVVVPLHPVANQSGVTTILEAMSMSRPVVVTSTPGQREIVTGPLVRVTGKDPAATADRGPRTFGGEADAEPTGWYVEPHDVDGLRQAIRELAAEPELRARMGAAARASVERNFRVTQFAERFANAILAAGRAR